MESKVSSENKFELMGDTIYMKSLINKTIEIVTVNGNTHKGVVYVVDPISESVVLTTCYEEKCDINIFLKHAITSFRICNTEENKTIHFTKNTTNKKQDLRLIDKRNSVKSWFEKNLMDVKEDGMNLTLGNDLIIEPPYDKEHCFSSNTIILQRIQEILSKMPDLS